jgi:hypothetical protein
MPLLYIGIAIAVVVIAFVVIVAMQPADFRVARSASIAAEPGDVFPHVNDLHQWDAWSPWAKIDPAMKQTYEGALAGAGAIYTWNGNNKVGAGRMTITESRPNELVRIQIEFMRPFVATNNAEFSFKPEGSQTIVTWVMTGKKVFVTKAIHLFISVDRMLGGMFEKGLAQLKGVVEGGKK